MIHRFISNRYIDKFGISQSIFIGIHSIVQSANIKDPYLLVDGNYNLNKSVFTSKYKYNSIIKGDSKVASIAAASIIAKVNRDRYMEQQSKKYPEYNFEKHKGYGTSEHIKKIERFGLSRLHRKSFMVKSIEPSLF